MYIVYSALLTATIGAISKNRQNVEQNARVFLSCQTKTVLASAFHENSTLENHSAVTSKKTSVCSNSRNTRDIVGTKVCWIPPGLGLLKWVRGEIARAPDGVVPLVLAKTYAKRFAFFVFPLHLPLCR